ncbi:MAG: pyridoxine 5'-phosphate synthase [Verrucomicrobiota bacterium]
MLKLGVNIDHVATLRQARYRGMDHGEPDPVAAALAAEEAGAHGITAHLREDRRHIQDRDVFRLREAIHTRLNFEMAIVPEILDIALRLRPHICCLVPEKRTEVTTEGGLDVAGSRDAVRDATRRLQDAGIEVSLFVDPDPHQLDAAARSGAQFVELHTGAYAEAWGRKDPRNLQIERLVTAARHAHGLGLQVNAGHGLNLQNLPLLHLVPHLVELNIGHSIISRAVFVGLQPAVREFLNAMQGYPG